jgi:hypothetical protein
VDALCFRPEVSVSAEGCEGLDLGDAILEHAYIDELLATSTQFPEFVAEPWDRVYQAAFVFHLHLAVSS